MHKHQKQPAERVPLGLRVTPDLKQRLDAAAEANGRSQAQECELRLERSFDRQDLMAEGLALSYGDAAGLILLLATAMDLAGRHSSFMATRKLGSWVENPFAFEQATRAAAKIIETVRPKGAVEVPPKVPFAAGLGEATANGLLSAIRGDNDGLLGADATQRLRALLGPLAKRLMEVSR